jgi:putative oxidoreductase
MLRATGNRSRPVRGAILTLSVLLALLFAYQGLTKFGESRLWTTVFTRIGLGMWFRYVTGAIEAGGAALLLYGPTRLVGALLLACTMVGALLTHVLAIGVGPQTVVVVVLLAALLFIVGAERA